MEKAQAKSPTGEAWYEFDYSTQECVISVADKVVPLNEYVKP